MNNLKNKNKILTMKQKCDTIEKKRKERNMEEEKRRAYSEVVEVLKLIDDEKKLETIPFEVVQLIKGNADPAYKPEISKEIPLEEQNLMDETYRIIAWIASKYWGEDIEEFTEEKAKEDNNISQNIDEIQSETNTLENIAEEQEESNVIENNKEENILPILVNEMKWYEKIKIRVIKFLKKIFGKKEYKEEGVN